MKNEILIPSAVVPNAYLAIHYSRHLLMKHSCKNRNLVVHLLAMIQLTLGIILWLVFRLPIPQSGTHLMVRKLYVFSIAMIVN